jgi:CheY-like chemotaxis protein
MGMPPEVLERVFEPFFTTKDVGRGTGLGLSMVHGFAEQSGGHVSIRSKEGEGTSVTILLRAVERKDAEPPGQDAVSLVSARGNEKVLVVEDDPQVLTFVSSQLSSLGYEVKAVSSGWDALKVLGDDDGFDLLFADVVLPRGMSGVELARRVREMGSEMKVLLTSGYPEEVFQQQGSPEVDILLLRKPYHRHDLVEAVQKALAEG